MRNFRRLLFATLLVFVLTGASFAGTMVNMTFDNVGGQSVGGVYTYPYYFTINGGTTPTALMCDSYDNHINFGESWTANVTSLLSGQGMFGSSALQQYEAAAIIFDGVLNGTIAATDGNLAIWALFSPNALTNSGWNATVQGIMNLALATTGNYGNSFYSHFVVYTPVGGSPGNGPQEFLGYIPAPEPMSLLLMGPALVGMLNMLRRGRKASA